MKKDGPIEPEYESGVIRISEEAWNQIKDLLTENMVHKKVDSTEHHLIFFNGEGYSELDFMMYEFNFCEQEMFYEDLSMALLDYANDEKITIQDMCELGISIVEGVDGQIINSTPLSEADVETLNGSRTRRIDCSTFRISNRLRKVQAETKGFNILLR